MVARRRSSSQSVSTKGKAKTSYRSAVISQHRELLLRYFPVWMILLAIVVVMLPFIVIGIWQGLRGAGRLTVDGGGAVIQFVENTANTIGSWIGGDDGGEIAVFFTDEIHYWEDEIVAWAEPHNLDPNLLATIMQIESCGHPTIGSPAGAQGLFQVMPFHFATGENMTDPDTNAMRGANVIAQCLEMSDGDIGLALACYNGGPSVLRRSINNWALETQRYYYWASGIYESAITGKEESPRLNEWLSIAGGLCDMAAAEQR